jgi:hypothetical protein
MSETQSTPNPLKSQVLIRDASEADVPFIFNSWLKSYRNSSACRSVTNPVYFAFQHRLIEDLLQHSFVKVVHAASDSNQLLGYIVYGEQEGIKIIHYVYVKHAFRNMGMCKMMLQDSGVVGGFYTHETPSGARAAEKLQLVYNPYLAGVLA